VNKEQAMKDPATMTAEECANYVNLYYDQQERRFRDHIAMGMDDSTMYEPTLDGVAAAWQALLPGWFWMVWINSGIDGGYRASASPDNAICAKRAWGNTPEEAWWRLLVMCLRAEGNSND